MSDTPASSGPSATEGSEVGPDATPARTRAPRTAPATKSTADTKSAAEQGAATAQQATTKKSAATKKAAGSKKTAATKTAGTKKTAAKKTAATKTAAAKKKPTARKTAAAPPPRENDKPGTTRKAATAEAAPAAGSVTVDSAEPSSTAAAGGTEPAAHVARSTELPLAQGGSTTPVTDVQPNSAHAEPASSSGPAQRAPVSDNDWHLLGEGRHFDPHSVLGAHPYDGAVTVRTMRPGANRVAVLLPDGSEHEMTHEVHGVWVAVLPIADVTDYRLKIDWPEFGEAVLDDAYRFMPSLGEIDLHLIGEGRHEQLWTVLGSHVRDYDGPMGATEGTAFAVWAPNAQAVRLICDANFWNGYSTQLRSLGSSGVWEIFYPGIGPGTTYRYEVLGQDGQWRAKSDPLAQWTEVPPANASRVVDSRFTWHDAEYLSRRTNDHHHRPMSVYEVHLGSWRAGLDYRELATQLTEYVVDLGFTHVEFLPVAEHPYAPSWGYQVTGYFAPTSRFGHPDDFRFLVDELHRAGIGVIVDWVPAHFPKDEWALARFDGQPLYEYADPRRGDHPDWGTHVFDFGRREVRNFLVANAIFWLEEFHVDGLRVDAVASMLYLDYSRRDGEWAPNQFGGREHLEAIDFLQEATATCYKRVPGSMMIAEESTAWAGVTRPTDTGGLGFGFKWNMGWMNDSLRYMAENPMYRQYHHSELTFSLVYAFSENYVLPISHDEVVHGKGSLLRKMPGDNWQQHANVRAFLAYMWGHPGKKLLFMGSEFAQSAEWNESTGLDWWLLEHLPHHGTQQLVRDLNRVYTQTPALWERDHEPIGFEWVDADDYQRNVLSFIRYDADRNPLVVVVNFAGAPHAQYRLGLPFGGEWDEVLNTDSEQYGGSGVVGAGVVTADDTPAHGRPASVELTVPPLAAVWLKPAPGNHG